MPPFPRCLSVIAECDNYIPNFEGTPSRAARIRAVLPRYSRLTDREILDQPFRLSDAQELAARTVGFESWEALRWGSHLVTHTRTRFLAMSTLVAGYQLFTGIFCSAVALQPLSSRGRGTQPRGSTWPDSRAKR